jgi:hypothetical protein
MATSKNEVPSFEVVAARLKSSCKGLAGLVEPCGDWPRLLFLGKQAGWNLELLDEYLTGDTQTDQNLVRNGLIPQLARSFGAEIAGLLISGWFVDPTDDPDFRHGDNVVGHPLRRECVSLLLVEANRAAAWVAEVERRPRQSPKLREWKGPGETGGAMVDVLRRGVSAKASA